MKRFFYSAFRGTEPFEGIVRAESIDSAREQLLRKGYEEISLSILSSADFDVDGNLEEIRE